jgi:hypothetical protein
LEEEAVLGGGAALANEAVEYDEDGNVKAKVTRQKTENIRCYVSILIIQYQYV